MKSTGSIVTYLMCEFLAFSWLPVTVATAERSFSKLKLIKTFNRSPMKDERLSGLAMISIESDNGQEAWHMTDVINTFATSKVRKNHFSGDWGILLNTNS